MPLHYAQDLKASPSLIKDFDIYAYSNRFDQAGLDSPPPFDGINVR